MIITEIPPSIYLCINDKFYPEFQYTEHRYQAGWLGECLAKPISTFHDRPNIEMRDKGVKRLGGINKVSCKNDEYVNMHYEDRSENALFVCQLFPSWSWNGSVFIGHQQPGLKASLNRTKLPMILPLCWFDFGGNEQNGSS